MNLNKYIDIIKHEFDVNEELIDKMAKSGICHCFDWEGKGFFIYTVIDGFTNKKEMLELFLYLHSEYRTARNLSRFIKEIEKLAKSKECDIIKISANSGHNDKTFIEYLKRKGYSIDTVYKEI